MAVAASGRRTGEPENVGDILARHRVRVADDDLHALAVRQLRRKIGRAAHSIGAARAEIEDVGHACGQPPHTIRELETMHD